MSVSPILEAPGGSVEATDLRVLIVDDEALARKRVRRLLQGEARVDVVGECANGPDAVAAIREQAPDLVLLDVQMPGMDGLAVIDAVGADRMPPVVFVTAHEAYALQAFDVHAVDYLLKPFDQDRLHEALNRARRRCGSRADNGLPEQLAELVQNMQRRRSYLQRVAVRTDGRVLLVPVAEVDWLEPAGNYTCMHAGSKTHIIRETMARLEEQLDPVRFARIHRSTMINLNRIRELQPYFHGDYKVLLEDGTELTLSRNFRENLMSRLGLAN